MEVVNEVITQHSTRIIFTIVALSTLIGIAMLLLKNRKEHRIIVESIYNDHRKRSNIIIDQNNFKINTVNKKDGYQRKNYRGTDVETAAWEDALFEKQSGKITVNSANIIDDTPPQKEVSRNNIVENEEEEQIDDQINGVKRSLMNEIITELRENREQAINSALESDSFTNKLAMQRKKEEESHENGRVA